MKKFLLSGFVIFVFIGYAIHQRTDSESAAIVPPVTVTKTNSTSDSPANPTPTNNTSSGSMMNGNQMMGGYKDGSYTGNSVDAYYGYVQIKATISGGKITDVQFLDYPQDRATSRMINSQAMPYLKQEAISTQSAQVDTISGASATSAGFIESLQSALDKAKA